MKPLVVLLLLPVMAPAQPADAQVAAVHREQVQVAPGELPRELTVACPSGEHVLSGGFAGAAPELRVISSRPSGGGWSVTVINQSNVARSFEISVVCAGVASQVVSATATSIDCPSGTVVTGGGYSRALVTGSYPRPSGWAVDLIPLTQVPSIEVYAVCASGVEPVAAQPVTLEAGSGSATCDGTLVGGGYQVTGVRLPSIATANVSAEGLWVVEVSGQGTITAICVTLPAPVGPISERDEILPIVAGACLLAGLFLALVLVMVARMRGRSRRPLPQGHVTVVLSAHRGAFRLGEMRELP